jgi:hypothetical protein
VEILLAPLNGAQCTRQDQISHALCYMYGETPNEAFKVCVLCQPGQEPSAPKEGGRAKMKLRFLAKYTTSLLFADAQRAQGPSIAP